VIWGDNKKELDIRLAHWQRESKNYGLQINFEKTVRLRLSRKEENQITKIKGREIKQVNRFTLEAWHRKMQDVE
jgi:hypothetical protein